MKPSGPVAFSAIGEGTIPRFLSTQHFYKVEIWDALVDSPEKVDLESQSIWGRGDR